jgi:hypothetical protein
MSHWGDRDHVTRPVLIAGWKLIGRLWPPSVTPWEPVMRRQPFRDPQVGAGRYVLLTAPSIMPHRRARPTSPSSSTVSQLTRKLSGAAASR